MMNSKVFYNFYLEKKLKLWKMKSFLKWNLLSDWNRSFDNFRPQVLKSVTPWWREEIEPNRKRFYSLEYYVFYKTQIDM